MINKKNKLIVFNKYLIILIDRETKKGRFLFNDIE